MMVVSPEQGRVSLSAIKKRKLTGTAQSWKLGTVSTDSECGSAQ